MPQFTYLQSLPLSFIFAVSFTMIILCYQAGSYWRQRKIMKDPTQADKERGAVTNTLLAMLGLFLAFSFNMASSRYNDRKNLIIQEANAIEAAYLRSRLFPDSIQKILDAHLKNYVEERIAYFEVGTDIPKAIEHYNRALEIHRKMWKTITDFAKTDKLTNRAIINVPAFNLMVDMVKTRLAVSEAKIPDSIIYILLYLSFSALFLLGYESKVKLDWVLLIGLALTLSAIIFTILDLDRSRQGLIDLSVQNRNIIELRHMFK